MLNLDVIAVSTTGRVQPGGNIFDHGARGEGGREFHGYYFDSRVTDRFGRILRASEWFSIPPDFGHDNSNTACDFITKRLTAVWKLPHWAVYVFRWK